MSFITSKKDYTHYARFYGIPCYWNEERDELVGRNDIFDWLLPAADFFHNQVVERGAQAWAAVTGAAYEPGFPILIWEFEEEKEDQ